MAEALAQPRHPATVHPPTTTHAWAGVTSGGGCVTMHAARPKSMALAAYQASALRCWRSGRKP